MYCRGVAQPRQAHAVWVRPASGGLQDDFPMKAMLSIVKSWCRGTWPRERSEPLYVIIYTSNCRGVAQSGSARGLGPRGRRFESCLPDQQKCLGLSEVFLLVLKASSICECRIYCLLRSLFSNNMWLITPSKSIGDIQYLSKCVPRSCIMRPIVQNSITAYTK